MRAPSSSPLDHSWPLSDTARLLGSLVDIDAETLDAVLDESTTGVGRWHCDLTDQRLRWSRTVYDLFGLPRDAAIDRTLAVGLYEEGSRARMERLRAYAIKHRRGFTLDVELRPAAGPDRWVRLVAAPVVSGGRTVALRGLKSEVGAPHP